MPVLQNQFEWRLTTSEGPRGRIGHTFCSSEEGTKAFIFGGLSANDDVAPNYLVDFWEYDVIMKRWREVELTGYLQTPRAFHTTVWYDDKMYTFGGCNGRGRFNKLFFIQPDGVCVVPLVVGNLPMTRYCHSAVVYNDAMYVYGGKCGGRNSNRRLNDLFMYHFRGQFQTYWTNCEQTGSLPEARSAHSSIVYQDSMLVFGGRNKEGNCCNDVQEYNFKTCHWRKYDIDATSFGRARNSCVKYNGYAILFGGWNGRKKLNDLVLFHMDSNTVERFDQIFPTLRECQMAVMCRGIMIIFGGRLKGDFMNETLELDLGPQSISDEIMDLTFGPRAVFRPSKPELLAALPKRLQKACLKRCEEAEVTTRPLDTMSDSIGPEIAEQMYGEQEE